MSYSEFSTQKADYVLQLEIHTKSNQSTEIFEDCDALVIEGTPNEYTRHDLKGLLYYYYAWGNQEAVFLMRNKKAKIFNLDTAYINFLDLEGLKTDFSDLLNPFQLPLADYEGMRNGNIEPRSKILISSSVFLSQDYIRAFRNAITAKKLEEFVAPKLKRELGRKPKVGLIYGSSHAGVESDLKYPWMRNLTIANYRFFDPLRAFRESIDDVLEIDFADWYGQLKEYKFPIFSSSGGEK